MEPRSIEAIEADIATTRERIIEIRRLIAGAEAQIKAWREEERSLDDVKYAQPAGKLTRLRHELAGARARRVWDTYPHYRTASGAEWCVVSVGQKRGKVILAPGSAAWAFTVADGKSVARGYFTLLDFDAERCRLRIDALCAAGIVHE